MYYGLIGFDEMHVHVDRKRVGFNVDGSIGVETGGGNSPLVVKLDFILLEGMEDYLDWRAKLDVEVIVDYCVGNDCHTLSFPGRITSVHYGIPEEAEIVSTGPVLLNGKPFGN